MNFFRNASIRAKLSVVLGMALVVGVGLVGLRQLVSVNNNVAEEISTVRLPGIELLDAIKRSTGEHRLLATGRIQTTTFRDLADITKHMEEALKRLRAAEQSFQRGSIHRRNAACSRNSSSIMRIMRHRLARCCSDWRPATSALRSSTSTA